MTYLFVTLLSLALSGFVSAEVFTSKIHSIDIGGAKEPHLIRFENGRVGFVEQNNVYILKTLNSHDKTHVLKVSADSKNDIYAISSAGPAKPDDIDENLRMNQEPYKPTTLKDTNAAIRLFKTMRKDYTANGECFNRAHIWTVEAQQKSNINFMKIFMFFTERYIRKYKFHWWFHVTPMAYVGNLKSPRTFDRRYTSGPRQVKTWSDTFVKSKKPCKRINTFDEYYLNQQSQDCYHIHTSMYYVIPRDIEKRDLTGVEKTEIIEREVRKAYKNAFKKGP